MFSFILANSADNHVVTFHLVRSTIAMLHNAQIVTKMSLVRVLLALCCVLKTFYQHCYYKTHNTHVIKIWRLLNTDILA